MSTKQPRRPPGQQMRYLPEPTYPAQRLCPHRIRSRGDNECDICGAIKVGRRWWHLRPDWFLYYTSGGERPS